MAIRTTLPSASITALNAVSKVRATTITLNASGLMPNSNYTFWCNGVNMTWACRTPGTKMTNTSPLTSDSSGSMTVYFAAEITPEYGSSQTVKYNSMQLRDINGNAHAISIVPQTLIGKQQ